MTYLLGVAQRWPILRTAAGIILVFSLAVPLTWVVCNLVVGLIDR